MHYKSLVVVPVFALSFALAATGGARAFTVEAGIDSWYTPVNGGEVTLDLPAGFFCGGASDPMPARSIKLEGTPLVIEPTGALGESDTLVERLNDIPLDGVPSEGGSKLVIRALSLQSVHNFLVSCPGGVVEVYRVRVALGGDQSNGWIDVRRDSEVGGTFDAKFEVNAKVKFINQATDEVSGIEDRVKITTSNACWSTKVGEGGHDFAGDIKYDADDDQKVESAGFVAKDFHPGWEGDPPKQCPTQHTGPHPVTCGAPGAGCPEKPDTNPCHEADVAYLAEHRVDGGFRLDALSLNAATASSSVSGTVTQAQLVSARRVLCLEHAADRILKGEY